MSSPSSLSRRKRSFWWVLRLCIPLGIVAIYIWLHSYSARNLGPGALGNIGRSVDYGNVTLPKIAICLTGGARKFELTGPSIMQHLLSAYSPADVFIIAPFDEDSHKFSLLTTSPNHIQELRIFGPDPVSEEGAAKEVLTGAGSPNGIQGLLQYFRLVEGCLDMIKAREESVGSTYEWVVRTRVDGYWNDKPLPIDQLPRDSYVVPMGSSFGGLNDRLGIGVRAMAEAALGRLRLLPKLRDKSKYGLNSEKSFHAQFEVSNIRIMQTYFPFCILSQRSYAYPPNQWGVPVASIASFGALSGAKCRPCRHSASGLRALAILKTPVPWYGGIGLRGQVELCDASEPWSDDWETIYDEVVGEKGAKIRTGIMNRQYKECLRDLKALKSAVTKWASPPPAAICRRQSMGALTILTGSTDTNERYGVFVKPLEASGLKAVMYSSGFFQYLELHKQLMKLLPKMAIHAFDASEEAMKWDEQDEAQSLPPTLQHYIATMGPVNGNVTLANVEKDGKSTKWWTPLDEKEIVEPYFTGKKVTYESSTLEKLMGNLANKRVDLLFVGLLVDDPAWFGVNAVVCQLVVSFDWTIAARDDYRSTLFAKLDSGGMHLATCLGSGDGVEQCTFFSSKHCEY